METDTTFYFEIPAARPELDGRSNTILQIGAIAGRLANETRTLVKHPDGRAENVAEHCFMLTKVATILAMEYYPELDAGRVSQFANLHDEIEAYTKDTPTHDPTPELLADKAAREKLGMEKFKQQYAHMPTYIALVEAYEKQEEPEAQFVRILDKFMPLVVHFNEGGKTVSSY